MSTRGRKPRQGPGRPEGVSHAREQILDAAEEIFAKRGYAGATLRGIVQLAKVTPALANYYFGTKEQLFEEVFARRGEEVVQERLRQLEDLRAGGRQPSVREIVRALLSPLATRHTTPAARRFFRMQAWLHIEPEKFALDLRHRIYDRTTQEYAKALLAALPDLPVRAVYWRLVLAIGAYLYAASDTNRLAELSGGICNPDDLNELLEQTTDFVCGGLLGVPAAAEQRPSEASQEAPATRRKRAVPPARRPAAA